MKLVFELLAKELERQNLLIATNDQMWEEIERQGMASNPRGPVPSEIYPNMLQLRDQIEEAIAYLKAR